MSNSTVEHQDYRAIGTAVIKGVKAKAIAFDINVSRLAVCYLVQPVLSPQV
jgi:FixJ family two-component response regulator